MTDPITSDNFHLSQVIPVTPTRAKFADVCTSRPQFSSSCAYICTDPLVLSYVEAATSASTRRAYASDLRRFESWGGGIPATEQMLARYLVSQAGLIAIATLARRLVAIRLAHRTRGLSDPTKSELVRLTFRGICRKHGRLQHRVAALTVRDLSAIVDTLGQSAKDIRDAAILLVGFAGALRRSELAAMDYQQIKFKGDRALIHIPRSKTDQAGVGRTIPIARAVGALCPVAALRQWLLKAGITEGPVFRPVMKSGKVCDDRISSAAIATMVKQRITEIGRNPSRYSGHSLRAGFATGAARLGVPKWRIKAQTGHLSDSALERYIREGELYSSDAPNVLAAFAEQAAQQ
jgi:integrase